jgi:nitric-oxide synthase
MNPSDTLAARLAPHPAPRPQPTAANRTSYEDPAALPVAGGAGQADPAEAEDFIRMHHREHPDQPHSLHTRLQEIQRQIRDTGTYRHSTAELAFGTRVAWRNSSRCIGRLYWNSLQVLDRRDATAPEEIHQHLITHLRQGTNGGRIRPVISVFAPDVPSRPSPRVWNDQLIRYAGYRQSDGSVIGDPAYADFTELVQRMGWNAPGGAFDVLPLVISTHDTKPQLFDVPADAVLEVPLSHPEHPWFADLELRWHALPAISNMRLRIGGLDYPLAPFNGWYMGTEIGARNLVDEGRYDLLPLIATRLGLDTDSETSLWRDRALVELNVAVLHSFNEAGARISDHHTESRRFLTHLEKEQRAGRTVPADWTWIVPPLSGGITPVFHRYYDQADQRPNFYLDDQARDLGRGQCPYHGG